MGTAYLFREREGKRERERDSLRHNKKGSWESTKRATIVKEQAGCGDVPYKMRHYRGQAIIKATPVAKQKDH